MIRFTIFATDNFLHWSINNINLIFLSMLQGCSTGSSSGEIKLIRLLEIHRPDCDCFKDDVYLK